MSIPEFRDAPVTTRIYTFEFLLHLKFYKVIISKLPFLNHFYLS